MGSTNWSDTHYTDRVTARAATGAPAFAYHAEAVRSGKHEAHKSLDPKDVKVRESRDSDAHPDSLAIAVLFDVTGSMQTVPSLLQKNLPKLMGLLMRKGYCDHPQVMVGAIGDATCDRVPLQVGQFESGIEIENDLTNLYLEGGGGSYSTESYELAMYFMAKHTSIDCFEKRGKKGYCFILGDEMPYQNVKSAEVKSVIGDTMQDGITLKEIVAELQQKYDVYFIIPNMTSGYSSTSVLGCWTGLLGQNVLRLEDPEAVCELIASTIGVAEGVVDLEGVRKDLEEAGSGHTSGAVTKALVPMATGRGTLATVPDSGAASGVATL